MRVQSQDKKPVEADLFVDGKAIGKSPGTFTVGVCSKELRANVGGQEAKAKLKLINVPMRSGVFPLPLKASATITQKAGRPAFAR